MTGEAAAGARTAPGDGSPEVSFVVIAHNEERHIAKTVESILGQDTVQPFEVLVVDDGSLDRTAAIVSQLAAHNSGIRLVSHERNLGRGAARATGVRAARGRWIAMVDADIVLPPTWWSTCESWLDRYDVVGGTAVPDGDVSYLHRRFRLRPKVRSGTTTVTGNNGAYQADALARVTFDAELREGEDVAINHALVQAGFRLSGIPGLTVDHQESKSYVQSLRWLFTSGVGATRQLARYRKLRGPDLAFVGLAAVSCLQVRRRSRRSGVIAPVVYIFAVATAHVYQRFEPDLRRPDRFVGAVGADATLLVAYFCGRVWGVVRLLVPAR